MAMTAHLDSLNSKHADLDAKIADEERRPHPDEATIHALKKLKLRIKDELANLERVH
ncbi:MAG: YdcH family protein [Rhodospirillaceae bacterium]|nr:YdcH family protein [Rhodospirillaceae bacterium]